MADYISREASVEYLMTNMGWNDEDGYPVDDADEKRKIITNLVSGIPAADVVLRSCYDRILAENDTMREQLAAIGKKPGDSMEDVEIVKIGHWIEEDGVQICSECGEEHEWIDYRASVCDCCGARMKVEDNT